MAATLLRLELLLGNVRTVRSQEKMEKEKKSKQQSTRSFSMREILDQDSGREDMNNQHVISNGHGNSIREK